MNIYTELEKNNIKYIQDEEMKSHTSFRIGGKADIFIKIQTVEELEKVINIAKNTNTKITIIGNGTNLLVKDSGIRGIVLKLDFKELHIEKKENECIVKVGSGFPISMLSQKLYKENIAGFEFAAGIPGTIGGAIRMNSGAHGKEMKDVIFKTTILNEQNEIIELSNEEQCFSYRNSIFSKNKYIIIGATLKLEYGNSDEIKAKMNEYCTYRKEKQPIEYPNAGSTFKRGTDFITAKLIDEAGLKGYSIGGAQVSEKHAGFIINKGNATSEDVINLIKHVKKVVKNKFNKEIESEVEIIGD